MALVKEIRFTEGPCKGGVARIYDDAYRDCTPEEIRRRKDAVAREIAKINAMAQRRAWDALVADARRALETWPVGGEPWARVMTALKNAPRVMETEAAHVDALMATLSTELLLEHVSPGDTAMLVDAARRELEEHDGERAENGDHRALPAVRAAAEGVSRPEKGRLRGGV